MSPLPLPIFHPQSITRQREQVALGELNNGVMNGVAIFFVTANLDCENRFLIPFFLPTDTNECGL
jgi:hypothetical protein